MLHRDFFKMLHLLYNIPLEKEVFYFDKKQEKSFGTNKAKKIMVKLKSPLVKFLIKLVILECI